MKTYLKDPNQPAKACVIWMHGLGADAQNMMLVAEQLSLTVPVRHVFLDAPVRPVTLNNHMPMRAWYDILALSDAVEEDRSGILASKQLIQATILQQIEAGFLPKQIFLAGFSQGGAMALYTGLHHHEILGGVISLSGYLPLAAELTTPNHLDLPIFIAAGIYDMVVLPIWTKNSYEGLITQGMHQVIFKEYPMEHCICPAELTDIGVWLNQHVSNLKGSV